MNAQVWFTCPCYTCVQIRTHGIIGMHDGYIEERRREHDRRTSDKPPRVMVLGDLYAGVAYPPHVVRAERSGFDRMELATMSGLASLNRYFAWGPDLRPWPGELEYLAGAELRRSARTGFDKLVRMPPALHLDQTVNRDTSSYAPYRR